MTDPMLIERSTLVGIADIVREKEGTEDDVPVAELEERLRAIAESGGGGTPKVCFPYSAGDVSVSLDAGSTGYNYTLTFTIKNFPSNRKLIGFYAPNCLAGSEAFTLLYTPNDESSIQGFWVGTVIFNILKDDGSDGNHVSVTQSDNTLIVAATFKLSASFAGMNAVSWTGALHYIYTEG